MLLTYIIDLLVLPQDKPKNVFNKNKGSALIHRYELWFGPMSRNKKKCFDIIFVFDTRKTHKFRVLHVTFGKEVLFYLFLVFLNGKLILFHRWYFYIYIYLYISYMHINYIIMRVFIFFLFYNNMSQYLYPIESIWRKYSIILSPLKLWRWFINLKEI